MGVNDAQHSYLLLEDLEITHHLPPAANNSPYGGWLSFQEVTLPEFEAVARKLAPFQARWWNDPRIQREPFVAPWGSLNVAGDPSNIPASLRSLEQLAAELPAETRDQVEHCVRTFPDLYQRRLVNAETLTLVHDDFHLRSVLLPDDPGRDEVMIIDWESVQRSIGVADIAYLIYSSMLPVDQRRQIERPVLAAYHDELLAGGVNGYSLEDCHADYRLGLVGLLSMCNAGPLTRSLASGFGEWNCESLVV